VSKIWIWIQVQASTTSDTLIVSYVIVPLGLNDVNDVVVSVMLTTLFFDAYVKDMDLDTSSSFNNVGHVDCLRRHRSSQSQRCQRRGKI
jgi:hypothetical protein